VPSQVSNYSPSTPMPDGAGAVQVVTPVRGTLGTNYTLTYSFSNGFSGFGAGIPTITALPVHLLSFQGKLVDHSVALNWITTFEQNSKLFVVERSSDGKNFYKIGSINAEGTSLNLSDYHFADNEPQALNYYRLKMVDIDGTTTYSQIIVVRYNDSPQQVTVLTNPFQSYIDLRFTKKSQVVTLQLLQVNGTLIEEKPFRGPTENLRWSLLQPSLSKGVYMLRITADQQTFIKKLIKK
jgi:trimeric autotransporter adhesin